jgi:hypothetical protein
MFIFSISVRKGTQFIRKLMTPCVFTYSFVEHILKEGEGIAGKALRKN